MPPSTFRAFETRKTRWAYTIATGITNIPGPILRELFSATHTWNKHKQTSFKLINLDCKDKHFPSIHQGFEGKFIIDIPVAFLKFCIRYAKKCSRICEHLNNICIFVPK